MKRPSVNSFGATLGEEIASAVTHGIGAGLSIAGLTLLVVLAVLYGDGWRVAGALIFGASMVFLYLASTLYHSIQVESVKYHLLKLDHVGIAMLIAGTYTPFLLVKMRNPQGMTFLAIIWMLAIAMACFKAFYTARYTGLCTGIYIGMGLLGVLMSKPLFAAVGPGGVAWLVAGGVAYILGTIPFMLNRIRYNHAVWHLFVIAGTACHFVAVLRYVIPVT